MDKDRIAGIALGIVILMAVFLLPFGSFQLPSGQLNGVTLFNMVMQLAGSLGGAQQPVNLWIHEILIVVSFIILVIAGALGIYPLRSGAIGVLGMILITISSIFNPVLGFNIPSYGAGYFIVWGVSVAAIVIGRLKPNARRKLSFLSSQAASEETVETASPPMDLFKPLSSSEASQTSSTEPSPATQPAVSLPFPPVSMNVIEEEITRIRAFLVVLGDEKKDKLISDEAHDRLSTRLQKILEELEAERKKRIEQVE